MKGLNSERQGSLETLPKFDSVERYLPSVIRARGWNCRSFCPVLYSDLRARVGHNVLNCGGGGRRMVILIGEGAAVREAGAREYCLFVQVIIYFYLHVLLSKYEMVGLARCRGAIFMPCVERGRPLDGSYVSSLKEEREMLEYLSYILTKQRYLNIGRVIGVY